MRYDTHRVASDWIAYARFVPSEAPEQVFADGWVLHDLVEDDSDLAWDVIKCIVSTYPEDEYYALQKTDAQHVVGLMAAGPLEDLLSEQGSVFIDAIEHEARQDRRMAWALGGVWQSTMTEDIWRRVQQLADNSYWERPLLRGS